MGKIDSLIKSEIQRLARREIRSTFQPLKREIRGIRLRLSSLAKGFNSLNRMAKDQMKKAGQRFKLEASPEEVKSSRFSPARIRSLRQKKGLSQKELASLVGVSMGTIVLWEKGKGSPKAERKGALVGLRRLGKREIRKVLEERKGAEPKQAPKPEAKQEKTPAPRSPEKKSPKGKKASR